MLRQSVFGRLAGYEEVSDAERLGRDPSIRWLERSSLAHARTRRCASRTQSEKSKHSLWMLISPAYSPMEAPNQ